MSRFHQFDTYKEYREAKFHEACQEIKDFKRVCNLKAQERTKAQRIFNGVKGAATRRDKRHKPVSLPTFSIQKDALDGNDQT